jgi:hypothetical protein
MRYRLLVVFCSVALPSCLEPLLERSYHTVRADRSDANMPNVLRIRVARRRHTILG